MTITAAVIRPAAPAVAVAPVVTARWVAGLFLICVLFQRFAGPGGMLLLPLVLLWTVAALRFKIVEIDRNRFVFYCVTLVLTGLLMPVQMIFVPAPIISVGSWALVMATWLPFVTRLIDRDIETYRLALGKVVQIGYVLAVNAIFMMVIQLLGVRYSDWPRDILPPGTLVRGYATTYPIVYGSPIYKANGWIGLEPAVMSVQLGMCLVAAVFLHRAVWKVLMITVALFCTVAGSGMLIAAVGLFAMLFRRRRGVMRATGTALGIGAVGVMFTPFGQTFLDRATEINRPTTSTSLRVVDPYVELWPRWIVDSVTPLLGLGPGSSQREVKGSGTLGLLVPNPAKIFFDYGLIVGLVLAAFLIYVHLDSPSPSLSFTFFFSLWTVQASTTSMVLAANVLIVATLWSPRPGLPLDDIPASADPDPPRPRSPAAEVPP